MSRPVFIFFLIGCLLLAATSPLRAAFGVTTDATYYTVDSGAGLVFKVQRSKGSITSIKLNDSTELNDTANGSHLISGLGSATCSVSADASVIVITVQTDDTNTVVKNLTHYFIVRNGENTIYMATYLTTQPSVGELRWITRLQGTLFPNVPVESNIRNNTGAAESGDVYKMPGGLTASKYYGNQQARDLTIRGVTGSGRGVFMVYGNRESSSGGPFFRDIQNQSGTDSEVYNQMNSGHQQSEAIRTGVLYGPYALCLSNGSTPAIPDLSFLGDLGLTGYVDSAGRGSVSIAGINGRDSNYTYTVGFANSKAQYWATADLFTGSTICAGIKPGTYTMTIYKGELSVYTTSVTVTAGQTLPLAAITITADPSRTVPSWRIGNWDGTPLELRNGANIPIMHPSDVRQASWAPGPFTVGTSTNADFPACQWVGVNNNQTVTFTLTSAQIAAHTVRIGITAAFAGGRPNISVNSWSNTNLPSASSQPDSRSMTIGTYRGNNKTYTFSVPASALVVGANTLTIGVISGSSGTTYLSPGYAIDCVDIYRGSATTLNIPGAPSGVSVEASLNPRTITLSWNAAAGAASYEIRRARSASGPYAVVASGLTALTWTDQDVAALGAYHYRLAGVNGSGNGPPAAVSIDPDGPPRPSAALKWTGASSAIWDRGTSNWSYSGGSTYFYYPEDTVRFDDTSFVLNLTLSSVVAPASVTFDATKNYALAGSGSIDGPTALTKSGSGSLTISNANTYGGGTTIHAGNLTISASNVVTSGHLGANGVSLANGTTLSFTGNNPSANAISLHNALSILPGAIATLNLGDRATLYGAVSGPADATLNVVAGALDRDVLRNSWAGFYGTAIFKPGSNYGIRIDRINGFTSSGMVNTTLDLQGASVTVNSNSGGNTIKIGALTGSASGSLGGTYNSGGPVTWEVGAKNRDTTFGGIIKGSSGVRLSKVGAVTLTLSGANTYTGATTVLSGSLFVTGSLSTTPITVASGATFGGHGTGIVGGTGIVSGNLTLEDGAKLAFGVTPSSTKGITVSGVSTLKGNITVVPVLLGGTLASGTYTVLKYTGTLGSPAPTFHWNDATFSGYLATINNDTTNKLVTITLTPPATLPATPSGLVATPIDSLVSLSWNPAAGATSYNVLRSGLGGTGHVPVATNLTTNEYRDSGLTSGATYYYVVVANNSFGTSGFSNEASATPVQIYAQWTAAAFPGVLDPNIIAFDADPDGDGRVNLLEYFHGTSPTAENTQSPITCTSDDQGNVVMTFPMSKNLSNVTYTVQQSTDLSTWAETTVTPTLASDQGSYYLMKATVPQGTDGKLFFRLSVTSN